MPLPRMTVASVALSVLVAGLMWSGVAPAIAEGTSQAPATTIATASVDAAVRATRSVRYVTYDADVRVGDSRLGATGSADLVGNRTVVDVHAEGASTEFRRVGSHYYVDARRLGAPGPRWVALDAAQDADQLSVRTVASFVTSLSPQHVLDALRSPVSATTAGQDSIGTRYRVQVARGAASLVPLSSALGIDPTTDSGSSPIDVWIDGHGHVARMSFATPGMAWTFSLSGYGEAVDIAIPHASQTASTRSSGAQSLFGSGMSALPGASVRAVTANPTVDIIDSVIQGNLNAVSTKGSELRFQAVSSTGGGKLVLGNVPGGGAQSFTVLPYATWLEGRARGVQTFTVKITEVTRAARYVTGLPLIGDLADSAIELLRAMPGARSQVEPMAGAALDVKISVDIARLAPEGTPVAFTYRVPTFDGTLISTNFFPAATEGSAPVALSGAGLGAQGSADPYALHGSDPYVPGTGPLREAGYHVITWDPRGEFASGGTLQLDNPFFEGRDVSAIVSWAAEQPTVTLNGPGDPTVGMVGGSYGGGIQLIVASMDPRIDAIVPQIAWNSMTESLNPHGILYKEGASRLLSTLTSPRIRIDPLLRQGLQESVARGKFSGTLSTLLAVNDMDPLLRQLQAPTLLVQGTVDALFPLKASVENAQAILSNPFGTPVKMIWMDPANDDLEARELVMDQSIAWLDKYVRGLPIPDYVTPSFQWWDQAGERHESDLMPFQPGFNQATPIEATGKGGSLTFTSSKKPSAVSLSASLPAGTQVVGAPTISFTYRGTGTARAVFAQIDGAGSGGVLGNIVTPVPVTLDGKERTVSVPLGDIVFSAESTSSLSIRILSSSPAFASSGSGRVSISNVSIAIPQRNS